MQTVCRAEGRSALAWATLLMAGCAAAAWAGWQRTLLDDEIWAAYQAARPLGELLAHVRGDLVHPPLWYLAAHGWLACFGLSDASVKALGLTVGLPALALFPWLAMRVTPRWRLATLLFAALYLRVDSVTHLARMYGLLLLLLVASLLLWARWRERPTGGRLLAWAAVTAAALWTHYFAALFLVALVAVNRLWGARPRAFALAAAAVLALFLPWVFYLLPVLAERGVQENLAWVQPNPLRTLLQLPFFFLSYIPAGGDAFAEARPRLAPAHWAALMTTAALLHLLLLWLARRSLREMWPPRLVGDPAGRWLWSAALLVGLPVTLVLLFSLVVTPALDARLVCGALPAYWLGMVLLGERGGRAGLRVLYAAVLPWALGSVLATLPAARPSPVRQGTLEAAAQWRAGDLVLADCAAGARVWWEWKRRLEHAGRIELLPCDGRPPLVPEAQPQRLESMALDGIHGTGRVWFFFVAPAGEARVAGELALRGFAPEEPGADFLRVFARRPGG